MCQFIYFFLATDLKKKSGKFLKPFNTFPLQKYSRTEKRKSKLTIPLEMQTSLNFGHFARWKIGDEMNPEWFRSFETPASLVFFIFFFFFRETEATQNNLLLFPEGLGEQSQKRQDPIANDEGDETEHVDCDAPVFVMQEGENCLAVGETGLVRVAGDGLDALPLVQEQSLVPVTEPGEVLQPRQVDGGRAVGKGKGVWILLWCFKLNKITHTKGGNNHTPLYKERKKNTAR